MSAKNKLTQVLDKREQEIATKWLDRQADILQRLSSSEQQEVTRQSREFLKAVKAAAQGDGTGNLSAPSWAPVREFLVNLSETRAKAGYTPTETASFIFSMKQPLFEALRQEIGNDADSLAAETWRATSIQPWMVIPRSRAK